MRRHDPTTRQQRRPTQGWWRQPRGATVTEYLIMALLGIGVLLTGIQIFGGGIGHQIQNVNDALSGETGDEEDPFAEARAASGSPDESEAPAAAGDDSSAATASADDGIESAPSGPGGADTSMGSREREEASGSVGGVNPLVLLLLMAAVLGLGYYIFADEK